MPFYTLLWHIGCQSDFDELVSMSSRPVDRGSGRMGMHLNDVSSGERRVWPDENALNVLPYGEKPVWPYGNC